MRTKSEIISGDKKLVSPLGKDGKLKNETEYEYGSKCNVCLRLFHQLKGIVQQHWYAILFTNYSISQF